MYTYVWVLEKHMDGKHRRIGIFKTRDDAKGYVERCYSSDAIWKDFPGMSSCEDLPYIDPAFASMSFTIEKEMVV